jgi:hypothetical protein
MPIRGHHLHFAVYHDRPISVSSLDRRRRREKLSRGGRSDDRSKERGCMTSDIAASARLQASGRLAHPRYSRRWRLSSHVGSCRAAIGRSSADPPSNAPGRASYDPAVSEQPRATQSRRIRHVLRQGAKRTRKLPTRPPLTALGAQLGRSQAASLRHFCDWLLCCNEGKPCPRPLCLRSALQ